MKKEIIYCDRCGEDIEKNKTKGEAIGLYLYRYDADVQGYESQYDLCDKCLAELKEWFGNKEEKAEKKVEEDIEERKKLIKKGKKANFMNAFHGETWYNCPFCGESFEYFDTWYSRDFEKTEFKDIYKHKCGNYIYFE